MDFRLTPYMRDGGWQTDGVWFEVLHPPPIGPAGKENVRSLVLHVKHAEWTMLLTGDLEEAGLARVLTLAGEDRCDDGARITAARSRMCRRWRTGRSRSWW